MGMSWRTSAGTEGSSISRTPSLEVATPSDEVVMPKSTPQARMGSEANVYVVLPPRETF